MPIFVPILILKLKIEFSKHAINIHKIRLYMYTTIQESKRKFDTVHKTQIMGEPIKIHQSYTHLHFLVGLRGLSFPPNPTAPIEPSTRLWPSIWGICRLSWLWSALFLGEGVGFSCSWIWRQWIPFNFFEKKITK